MSVRFRGVLVGGLIAAASLLAAGGAAARPLHITIGHRLAQPPTITQCLASFGVPCYGPPQFQTAYDMKSLYASGLTGAGRTIVIVDSFGSPTIAKDIRTFDEAYGLPNPDLEIIHPVGAIPPYNPDNSVMTGWATETTLDVEYSHTMAPGAKILLVETPEAETEGTIGFPQIVAAENYVIDHHMGDVISQSFGATEETFPSVASLLALRSSFKNARAHHVTVLGSSGDVGPSGYTFSGTSLYPFRVNSWPSSDPLVTSLGGTQLHLTDAGIRTAPDSVWNDTALFGSPAAGGGGLSAIFGRPEYQNSVANVVDDHRGTPDLSMSAAVNGAALIYAGFKTAGAKVPGWELVGGTSEASPLFSGVVAIADQAAGHDLGLLNPRLYRLAAGHEPGIIDIVAGNNTVSFKNHDGKVVTVPGWDAVPGYDLASGLGTADGAKLVAELAAG